MVPAFFRVSLGRFFWLLVAYALTRLLFLAWNWPMFEAASSGELLTAFTLGAWFDTSAILLTNALSFLAWMLPLRWLTKTWVRRADIAWFGIINLICLGGNFADAEFVKFIGKRTSFDLLFIREDVERQSLSILATYWHLFAGLILTVMVLLWVIPKFNRQREESEGWMAAAAWRVATAALLFLGMRGGFGYKPINPMQAYFSTKHELGLLTLNTPINVIKTRPNGHIERTRYFATDREAILRLKDMTDLSRPPLGVAKGWNVVILIVESLAQEFIGAGNPFHGYTPFIDSLAQKSFFFHYNFANARRSIEGIPAVLCGLPAIMEEPIITSDFSSNRMDCLPQVLQQNGYSTAFLHGAHNGSMHFDSFSRLAGFASFVGLNEYPKGNNDDFDGYWGVLDEPMLQYAVKTLDQMAKPAFLSLFTLSSHHPYYIPERYRGRFPKGDLEIYESLGYADYAIQQFFKAAESKPWFNKTIFIITGDHTQKTAHKEFLNNLGFYRVPLLIYAPGLIKKVSKPDPDRITQHVDIMPSVLDLLGINNANRILVGQSVFDEGKPGRAYNYTSYSYWYIDPKVYIDFGRPPYPLRTYTYRPGFELNEMKNTDPRFQDGLLDLKAVIHYMNEGLTHNRLYTWKESL